MAIHEHECKVIRVSLQCDECGGEIKALSVSEWRKNEKAQWEHICHGPCGKVSMQERQFPYYKYVIKE